MLLLQSWLNEECSATRPLRPRAERPLWPVVSEIVETAGGGPGIAESGRQCVTCGPCRRINVWR
jgi:hypothetical protein